MRKTEVRLIDDIDGSPASETVKFGIDGDQFEIELNADNAAALRNIYDPYVERGRKPRHLRGTQMRPRRTSGRTRPRSDSADIRRWAKAHGLPVNDRGRIPASIIEQYEANH